MNTIHTENVIRVADANRDSVRSDAQPTGPGATSAVVFDLAERRARRSASENAAASRPLTMAEVWNAIEQGRIELHYQPQFDLTSGAVVSAEALLRLKDINGKLVFPDRFIEFAEDSDLIVPLGRAVIERACRDLAEIRSGGGVLPRIAINVSAYQLSCDDELIRFIDDTLAVYGLVYTDLEFELTERQRLDADGQGARTIAALAGRGARLSIDDFGVGYSSVLCLTELPISTFKLDKALINRLPDDIAMQGVVTSLLAIGDHLGLDVVAEGVETEAQHNWLLNAGCPSAQGYGYARPMTAGTLRSALIDNDGGAFAVL